DGPRAGVSSGSPGEAVAGGASSRFRSTTVTSWPGLRAIAPAPPRSRSLTSAGDETLGELRDSLHSCYLIHPARGQRHFSVSRSQEGARYSRIGVGVAACLCEIDECVLERAVEVDEPECDLDSMHDVSRLALSRDRQFALRL